MPREMKRHDTADPITFTCRDANGRVDLRVFSTITFQMKVAGAQQWIGGAAVNIELAEGGGGTDPTDSLPVNRGKGRYVQTDGDVDTAATYVAEVECVLANGKKVHFPSRESANETVTIGNDLDNA